MTSAVKTKPYSNPRPLNYRQKQVAVNVTSGMTQTEAYQRVYKCDYETAKRMSSLLIVGNPLMKPFIDSLMERKKELALAETVAEIMQPHEVKARLSELARANLVDFLDVDGKPKLSKDTPHHSAAKRFYRKSRIDRNGNPIETTEIGLVDQIEALRELAKIHGLYAPSKHLVAQKVQFDINLVERKRPTDED